jgi:hypothetical protein
LNVTEDPRRGVRSADGGGDVRTYTNINNVGGKYQQTSLGKEAHRGTLLHIELFSGPCGKKSFNFNLKYEDSRA